MIEQAAVVISTTGDYALVEAQRQSSCGSCNAKQGCGTGLLENSLGRRAMRMTALNQCAARDGDEVVVAVPEKGFIKSALFTYFLPLLLMLVGAILAQQLGTATSGLNTDLAALVGAISGFVLALFLLRAYSKKIEKDPSMHPVIIRKARKIINVGISSLPKEQQPF